MQKSELAPVVLGVGIDLVILTLNKVVRDIPQWANIVGFSVGVFLVLFGFGLFFWNRRTTRGAEAPNVSMQTSGNSSPIVTTQGGPAAGRDIITYNVQPEKQPNDLQRLDVDLVDCHVVGREIEPGMPKTAQVDFVLLQLDIGFTKSHTMTIEAVQVVVAGLPPIPVNDWHVTSADSATVTFAWLPKDVTGQRTVSLRAFAVGKWWPSPSKVFDLTLRT